VHALNICRVHAYDQLTLLMTIMEEIILVVCSTLQSRTYSPSTPNHSDAIRHGAASTSKALTTATSASYSTWCRIHQPAKGEREPEDDGAACNRPENGSGDGRVGGAAEEEGRGGGFLPSETFRHACSPSLEEALLRTARRGRGLTAVARTQYLWAPIAAGLHRLCSDGGRATRIMQPRIERW